ncbi:Nn.00g002300.m01.CDS01 [Neocucurbitaria sp. VM-36]
MSVFSKGNILKMGTKVIAVRVGVEPNQTDFTVHEALIRKSSPFFQACLSRPWRMPQERVVRLLRCRPAAFTIYVQWLYTNRLHAFPVNPSGADAESTNLVYGCDLGYYLQDGNYQDTIIDAMILWKKKVETADRSKFISSWAETIYKVTTTSSPFRKLLVDMIVWDTSHDWRVRSMGALPYELIQDIVIGLSARCEGRPGASPLEDEPSCSYHCHGKKPCYKADQTG